jgi:hypothetical protein
MFAYVHNHSISHIDPTGNWDLDVKLVLVTTVSALALTRLAVATGRAKLVLIPVVLELVNTALIAAVYVTEADTAYVAGVADTAAGIASTTKKPSSWSTESTRRLASPTQRSWKRSAGAGLCWQYEATAGINGSLGGLHGGILGDGGSGSDMALAWNSSNAVTFDMPRPAIVAQSIT